MADAPQQEQAQEQPAAPQEPYTQRMSDEDIMAKAIGQSRPTPNVGRDDATGRFQSNKPQEWRPESEQAQQPQADAEKPAEEKPQADQPEHTWDELKGIKLKIPMKNGDKEWEDEITLDELRNQRMMHSDYMARRREMDAQAKTHQEQSKQALEKERQGYLANLQALHQSIVKAAQPELSNVDWNKLAAENPAEYVRLANRAREVNSALERVRFEHEKTTQTQAKDRDERLATAVAESRTKLLEAIPAWNEDTYQKLLKRGVDSYGFKPQEIGQVWDHRIIQLLHDADQWRRLKEEKPAADKKVENTPAVLRPGPQKPKVNPQEQQFRSAQERLRKDGKDLEAGAEVMAAFLRPKQGRA